MKNSHRRMSSVRGASLLRRLADMPGEGGADRLAHRFDVALQGREVGRLAGAGEPPLQRLGGGLRLEAAADGQPQQALTVAPDPRRRCQQPRFLAVERKSTRLNSSHNCAYRIPSSAL